MHCATLFCPSGGPRLLRRSIPPGLGIASNTGPISSPNAASILSPHDLTITSALLAHQASRLFCVYRCFRTYSRPSRRTQIHPSPRPTSPITHVTHPVIPLLSRLGSWPTATAHVTHLGRRRLGRPSNQPAPGLERLLGITHSKGIRIICTDSRKLIGFFVEPWSIDPHVPPPDCVNAQEKLLKNKQS